MIRRLRGCRNCRRESRKRIAIVVAGLAGAAGSGAFGAGLPWWRTWGIIACAFVWCSAAWYARHRKQRRTLDAVARVASAALSVTHDLLEQRREQDQFVDDIAAGKL